MSRAGVSSWAKLGSRAVQFYCDCSPIARGKDWLLRHASSFLVAPIDNDLWIRVTGLSGFEWKALRRTPGEYATTTLIRRMLKPGAVMFDVGANVGYFSLLAAKAVASTGRVYAFEATPAVAERLAENVNLNGLDNVSVIHSAVCDRDGEVEFRIQIDDSEGNSLVNFSGDWPRIRVPAMTLDEFVARNQIDRVDLIKIDVEGAEPLVLKGAKSLLTRPGRPALVIEVFPAALRSAGSSKSKLLDELSEYGYRVQGLEQLTKGPDAVWNILAVHPEHGCQGFPNSNDFESIPEF